MKKVILVVALIIVLDAVALVLMVVFCWHPLLRLGSSVLVHGGELRARQNDYAAAVAQFGTALRLDPQNVNAYVGRAYARVYLGQFDAALEDGNRAVALDGRSGPAHGARGWAREWKKDWEGAHADYDLAIKESPNVAAFYAHRGWARFEQHENDGAMTDFNQALHLDPHLAFAYHDRGWVKFTNDDLPGALDDENAAVEFDPAQIEYYLRRSNFRMRSDDAEGSLADAKQALNLQPQSPEALYREAVAWRRLGDTADSVIALDEVLQINPNYAGVLFERAMSHYVAGDLTGALTDLKANRVNQRDRPQTELWLWIVQAEQGAKANADLELGDYLSDARDVKDGTWPEHLDDLLLGRTTPEALAALPEFATHGREERAHLCQLWFYAAKVALVQGNKAAAKTDLQAAVATHAADVLEFGEARRELATM